MADHLDKNTHKRTVDKKVPSPASILRNIKDKSVKRNPLDRGKATKNPSVSQ